MKELIQRLCQVYGPSGQEEAVRDLIRAEIGTVVDDLSVDRLGNLIAVKRANVEGPLPARRIMLAAHMDEIGVMVSHVEETGFLRFAAVGSMQPAALLGSRLVFANGVHGVVGLEGDPLAATKPEMAKLFLDVGAPSADELSVAVGDVAVWRGDVVYQGQRLFGPNFDDRIGCAVLVQLLREINQTPHHIAVVFTVQEEVGVRGATTAAFGVEPEIALAVDVTPTGDYPGAHPMDVALGRGPAIKVLDRRMIAHPGVRRWLSGCAQAYDIPYQNEVLEFGSTDASAIQVSRGGVAAGAVSIPCRYIHTPAQAIDYDDVQHTVRLLVNALNGPVDL